MTSSTPISRWKRLLLEGGVIVISILLAFALDAWWDGRKDRKEELNQLESLRYELNESLPPLASILESIQSLSANVEQLSQILEEANGEPVEIPGELLGSAVSWRTSDVSTSTLDALMASGDLNLLSNPELRFRLAGLPSVLLDLTEDEKIAQEFVEFHMIPLVAREGLAKIAMANRIGFDNSTSGGEIVAHSSQEFAGMLAAKRVHLAYSELGIPRVQAYINNLIELIDTELDSGK